MGYQPKEEELKVLGFRTDSPAQPFPTRSYWVELPNKNYLLLTPRPAMQSATEFTPPPDRLPVARHAIDSLADLERSVLGQGKREKLTIT